jgi:hypothetical protein
MVPPNKRGLKPMESYASNIRISRHLVRIVKAATGQLTCGRIDERALDADLTYEGTPNLVHRIARHVSNALTSLA